MLSISQSHIISRNLRPTFRFVSKSCQSLKVSLEDLYNGTSKKLSPFTNLSQVDADLALARTLQDQERAYMMLRMNGDGSDHESWETGSYVHDDDDDDEFDHHNSEYDGSEGNEEEDAFDIHAHLDIGSGEEVRSNQGVELDSAYFPNDETYARVLQDAEDEEMAARLLALTGINEMVTEEDDDHGDNSQCAGCQGSGMKVSIRHLGPSMIQQMQRPCNEWKGTGETINDKDRCPQCKGEKVVQEKKVLEVHVENGMQNSQKITFP